MKYVSIHTPTQGVTSIFLPEASAETSFNPHTHAGCDACIPSWSNAGCGFQSTHPRRVWHACTIILICNKCFNPHTHAGCDALIPNWAAIWSVSIHTPTQGVTVELEGLINEELVSIHTPTQGVTGVAQGVGPFHVFQSTHPRRVWLYI